MAGRPYSGSRAFAGTSMSLGTRRWPSFFFLVLVLASVLLLPHALGSPSQPNRRVGRTANADFGRGREHRDVGDDDSNSIFDDSFYDAFDKMDQEDRVHDQIDEGFDNWEERCLEIGGQSALDNYLKAQENLVHCFLENFDVAQIQREIDSKKKTGELELVFKQYCGEPVAKTRPCMETFLEVSRHCVRSGPGSGLRRSGLNATMRMIDAAIDFICHDNGDRIALFMSEDGLQCVQDHQEPMIQCVNRTIPELFHMNRQMNANLLLLDQQSCRKGETVRHCIEQELLLCPDPTPSNVVNSMLVAMREASQCQHVSSRFSSGATTTNVLGRSWPAHLLVVVLTAGLVLAR